MTYAEYIARMKQEWVGRKVVYEGRAQTVVDVDYNGLLLIDRPGEYNGTMAVEASDLEKVCPRREPGQTLRLALQIITLAISVAVLIRMW